MNESIEVARDKSTELQGEKNIIKCQHFGMNS